METEEEVYADELLMSDSLAKRSGYFVGGSSGLALNSRRQEDEGQMERLGGGKPRNFYMTCDKSKKWKITTKSYPQPGELQSEAGRPDGTPALWPVLRCDVVDSNECKPEKWVVKELLRVDDDDDEDGDDKDADQDGKLREYESRLKLDVWASKQPYHASFWPLKITDIATAEHIYEANWIRNYFDHLYDTPAYFSGRTGADRCEYIATKIARIGVNEDPAEFSLSNSMINNIGNDATYKQTMVLFTQKENGMKYLVRCITAGFECCC